MNPNDSPENLSPEKYPRHIPELPATVFNAWKKPQRALNPVAVIATVDPDRTPHTAPFGSLRAVTPRLLRFITWHGHDTYTNICRDGRVMVFLLSPPDSAVRVGGKATVVKEHMDADNSYAVVEVSIDSVKNDMVPRIVLETALTISVPDQYAAWFEKVLGEIEID